MDDSTIIYIVSVVCIVIYLGTAYAWLVAGVAGLVFTVVMWLFEYHQMTLLMRNGFLKEEDKKEKD